jgi:hypothetical protein
MQSKQFVLAKQEIRAHTDALSAKYNFDFNLQLPIRRPLDQKTNDADQTKNTEQQFTWVSVQQASSARELEKA